MDILLNEEEIMGIMGDAVYDEYAGTPEARMARAKHQWGIY